MDIDILLPEVPDERDECVARIIHQLQYKCGINEVHVVPENGNNKAQLSIFSFIILYQETLVY